MTTDQGPYVGPRPFEQGDRQVFFGRDQETVELVSLVVAHQVVLLYAQSGAGKTSLVRARLIPLLIEEESFEALPVARVRGQSAPEAEPPPVSNIYVYNALAGMYQEVSGAAKARDSQAELQRMSFAEFLARRRGAARPAEQPSPMVVVFDQFEEIFTLHQERWADRYGFFAQVRDALAADPLLRVVFSMREDFIAELDPYAAVLPDKLRTRYRIERLRRRPALLAVKKPLERAGGRSFAPGVAEELVDNLLKIHVKSQDGVKEVAGEFVEPLQLQVVCQSLWRSLGPSDRVITGEHVAAYGNVDQALKTFYEEAVRETTAKTGVKEGVLRRWLARTLVTPTGTRGTIFRGERETGGLPNGVLDELENQRLVRVELRGGAQWYELTHDRLIEVIRASNQKWELDRSGAEQTRRRLEERAADWEQAGRPDEKLLDEVELLEAERWLAEPDAAELGHSESVAVLVKASRREAEERQQRKAEEERRVRERARVARRMQVLSFVLALVCLAAVGLAVYAFELKRQAQQKEEEARQKEEQARQSEREAQDNFLKYKEAQRKEQEAHERAEHSSLELAESSRRFEEQQQLRQLEAEANNLFLRSDFGAAVEAYKKLLTQYETLKDNRGQASTWIRLGDIYGAQSNYPYALNCYKKALGFREKERGANSEEVAAICQFIADASVQMQGDRASLIQALGYIKRAQTIYRSKRLRPGHHAVVRANETRQLIQERLSY